MILAIETSGAVGSVALCQGEVVLGLRCFDTRQEAVRRLPPAIRELLEAAGDPVPEGLAVSSGPGSFNGLRVGLALAKAMAHAWQRPVVGVSTPQVWAAETAGRFPELPVAVLQPSRRGYVYLTVFGPGAVETRRSPEVVEVDQLAEVLTSPGAGRGSRATEDSSTRCGPVPVVTGDWQELAEWAAERAGVVVDPGRAESPSAVTLARLAGWRLGQTAVESYFILRPEYVSPSQAERNRGVNLGL